MFYYTLALLLNICNIYLAEVVGSACPGPVFM